MARRLNAPRMRVSLSPRARRNLLVGTLALMAFGLAVIIAAYTRACAGNSCPSIGDLGGYDPNQASKVYAADGRLITDLGLERRTVVPLAEMSPYVRVAFITTEDKRFYQHHGIDWYRVFGAIKNNIFKLRVAEGFSTITMQLARNLWPEDISGRDKSLRRKLREAQVAREIEAKYPKDKILELYLNQIDLGNRAYGVEAASQRYFGKSVRDLNVAEAATLAAIPKAPSRYNPRKNPNLTIQRRNTVLNLLRDNALPARGRLGVTSTKFSVKSILNDRLFVHDTGSNETISLVKWIRENDAFSVTFTNPEFFFGDGALYQRADFVHEVDAVRRCLQVHAELAHATSEKGVPKRSATNFPAASVFRIVEDSVYANSEWLCCLDLGDEWAD